MLVKQRANGANAKLGAHFESLGLWGVALVLAPTFLTAGCAGSAQTPAANFAASEAVAAQRVTEDYQSVDVGSPGAIVGVSCPQGTWYRAFGFADTSGTPMKADMQFRIASSTKVFTAVAVLKLVDSKLLQPSDSVSKYLANPNPAFTDWSSITLEELANHTSGLSGPFPSVTNQPYKPADLFAYATQIYAPGLEFKYANINFTALGLVVENTAKESLDDYYQEQFFTPLGLTNTVDATSGSVPSLVCHGYENGVDVTSQNPTWSWGAGTIVSNAQDMTKWIRAVGTGQLLSPNTMDTLLYQVPPTDETGFGIQEYNGWIGHLGDLKGYASACFYNPTIDASVVVMVNRLDFDDEKYGVRRQFPIVNDVIGAFFPHNPIDLKSNNEG